MIYVVYFKEFDDFYIEGYFTNKEDAKKYCLDEGYGFYFEELKDLSVSKL